MTSAAATTNGSVRSWLGCLAATVVTPPVAAGAAFGLLILLVRGEHDFLSVLIVTFLIAATTSVAVTWGVCAWQRATPLARSVLPVLAAALAIGLEVLLLDATFGQSFAQ